MVEVNGANMHGRSEQKLVCVMSNVNVFALKNSQADSCLAGQPAEQTQLTI